MNILVVEDIPVNALMLRNVLEHDGNRVWMSKTGVEALEMLDQHPNVQLLVADIIMPEMDGLELVRTLRAREELKTLPVMFLTADASSDTVREAMRLGATGYILKPMLEPSTVLARINEVLAGCPPVLGPPPGACDSPDVAPSPLILRELAVQVSEFVEAGDVPEGRMDGSFTRLLEQAGARRLLEVMGGCGAGNRPDSRVLLREIRALAAELGDRGYPVSLHPAG